MSAYILSKQVFSLAEFHIQYIDDSVSKTHIITFPVDKAIVDVIDYIQADFIANSIPISLEVDGERLYFETTYDTDSITSVAFYGDADGAIALGGTYTYSGTTATADVFGARLPFTFTLESPNDYANINDQVGGVYEKEIYQKTLAGETYNGVNGSSSSRFLRRKGWLFNLRINEVLLEDFDWFVESCRDTGAVIYEASDFNILDTIDYVIQPEESKNMTPVYKHLDIYEINLAFLEA